MLSGCVQQYNPPIRKLSINYLIVDGIIVNGQDSTVINLSRTQNITDSAFTPLAETGAICTIIGQYRDSYTLSEQPGGRYVISSLNLNNSESYQLQIVTTNGQKFLTDPFPVRQTPPVDSIHWQSNGQVISYYMNTHDPANNTKYYRWQYVATWQYHSIYPSELIYQNGMLSIRTPDQQVYNCWDSVQSTDILVGTSAGLSSDVIYEHPLFSDSLMVLVYPVNIQLILPEISQKYSVQYSVLVNQYAITEAAYNYWTNLRLNTEELGGLFSPEPSSQVSGNIHCITDTTQPVIGYITASTVRQKRIFVSFNDLFVGGGPPDPKIGCYEFPVFPDSINFYFSYQNLFTPVSYEFRIGGALSNILAAPTYCTDCRAMGGINVKPGYWP